MTKRLGQDTKRVLKIDNTVRADNIPELAVMRSFGEQIKTAPIVNKDMEDKYYEAHPKEKEEKKAKESFKQGGRLKLIPKAKSGIHIKESQRGSFTRYCGGNVTNECIQRGKNSPDPKIRKKATFAQSVRKWNRNKK